jgi:hypothetical protein
MRCLGLLAPLSEVGRSRRRSAVPVACGLLIALCVVGGGLAASTRNPPTEMYAGVTHIGRIIPTQIGRFRAETWEIDCPAAESQFLMRGRAARDRARINLHHWDGYLDGLARSSRGRWLIYRGVSSGTSGAFVAYAVHRSPWHWDVFRASGRKIGRTLGPDGPEAATALALVC